MRDPERTSFASYLPLAASPRVPKSILSLFSLHPADLSNAHANLPCKTEHPQLRLCPHQPLKDEAWLALLIPSLCAVFFLIPFLCSPSPPPPAQRFAAVPGKRLA